MKLRELKCKNCGAKLKVEENISKVECEFCHTSFAVDDAYHDGYKFEKGRMKAQSEHFDESLEKAKEIIQPFGKVFIAHSVVSFAIFFIIFIFIIIGVFTFAVSQSNNSVDEFDIRQFNNKYEMYVGTESGFMISKLIDEVVANNKKDKEHQITFIYKEINTSNPDEIKNIKSQLNSVAQYEVSLEYDEVGFIYQVMVE